MEDNYVPLDSLLSSSSSSLSFSTSTSTSSSSSPSLLEPTRVAYAANEAAASSSSTKFIVPAGWTSKPRQTDYYAVPVIISVSVILAVIVIGAIVGSVVWRRKAKHQGKRRRAADPEKSLVGKKDGGGKGKGKATGGGTVGKAVGKVVAKEEERGG
ncbi:hypothetical protein RQP46_008093 [Phenoliferia psychrophenolica]